jgi:hypothetical protein
MWSQILLYKDVMSELEKSNFRNSFHLTRTEKEFLKNRSIESIAQDVYSVLLKRIKDPKAYGFSDGKQTPFTGWIFKSQHATATCCRKCISKWHKIPIVNPLTDKELKHVLIIILRWISKEIR